MAPLYVTEQGARVELEAGRVAVTHKAAVLASLPLQHVSEVVLLGNVGLTTPAAKRLLAAGVDVVFLTLEGEFCGRLAGPGTPHVRLRRQQYQRLEEPAFGLEMARAFVRAKLQHQRALLQRHARAARAGVRAGKAAPETAAPPGLDSALSRAIAAVAEALEAAARAASVAELMGLEGAASAAYFGGLRHLLGDRWGFVRRQRRPPTDAVNVLLSLGYTLLGKAAVGAVAAAGLDPYAGFLHAVDYNRPSLGLDLLEEFRPVVDGVVLWCCNSGQITPADFTPGQSTERPVVMSDQARRRFLAAYERRMAEAILHPQLQQRLRLRQCVLAQARQVVKAVQSGRPDYTPMGFR